VDSLLKTGYKWVVDADLKSYFDTIPHERLMALVEEHIADGRVLAWLRAYLKAKVLDGLKEWIPEEGSPQGAVISPMLANLYLNPLDQLMARKGFEMVRYADDFVILCQSREEAESALTEATAWVKEAGLTLHPEKTRIVHESEGFDFLGYRFENGRHTPRRKSEDKFKDGIRDLTRRNNGRSLDDTIARLTPKLRGWYGYFKHSPRWVLKALDKWIRRRLRTILNKREGRSRWKCTKTDHRRWPNAFFQAHGLFNLTATHVAECQSLRAR
jgi:RNA-directed DNA polymerase